MIYTYFPPFLLTLLHPSHSFFTELRTYHTKPTSQSMPPMSWLTDHSLPGSSVAVRTFIPLTCCCRCCETAIAIVVVVVVILGLEEDLIARSCVLIPRHDICIGNGNSARDRVALEEDPLVKGSTVRRTGRSSVRGSIVVVAAAGFSRGAAKWYLPLRFQRSPISLDRCMIPSEFLSSMGFVVLQLYGDGGREMFEIGKTPHEWGSGAENCQAPWNKKIPRSGERRGEGRQASGVIMYSTIATGATAFWAK
jgi:hypothetical protein